MRVRADAWSLAAIAAVNGFPVVLVLAGLADAGQAVLYYWLEFSVVGIFGLVRIAGAVSESVAQRAENFAIAAVIYPLMAGLLLVAILEGFQIPFKWTPALLASLAVLVAIEGASFGRNFLAGRAYRRAESGDVMAAMVLRGIGMFALVMSVAFACYHFGVVDATPYLLVGLRTALDVLVAARARA